MIHGNVRRTMTPLDPTLIAVEAEDLEVDEPNANTVEYLTPTSIFMGGEGSKYLDLSRCTVRRREEILCHKAREGVKFLITRSGTLGRVTIVGRTLLEHSRRRFSPRLDRKYGLTCLGFHCSCAVLPDRINCCGMNTEPCSNI